LIDGILNDRHDLEESQIIMLKHCQATS